MSGELNVMDKNEGEEYLILCADARNNVMWARIRSNKFVQFKSTNVWPVVIILYKLVKGTWQLVPGCRTVIKEEGYFAPGIKLQALPGMWTFFDRNPTFPIDYPLEKLPKHFSVVYEDLVYWTNLKKKVY